MAIYAARTPHEMRSKILASLHDGEARFGWSYLETADLRELQTRIQTDGVESLTPHERACYQRFLLDVVEGDYIVYVNEPEQGLCTAARVAGPYLFRYDDHDFNHRFPVVRDTVFFDRNDACVHPALSRRLKLQGRWWRIWTEAEFHQVLSAHAEGDLGKPITAETHRNLLWEKLQPILTDAAAEIHHAYPNVHLERFMAEVYRRVPGVVEVQERGGPADHGDDLLVTYEQAHPLTSVPTTRKVVVQVKSYYGQAADQRAISDLKRAFEAYPDADEGLIATTATSISDAFEAQATVLAEATGKPVYVLYGSDLAAFVLRHGVDYLTPKG